MATIEGAWLRFTPSGKMVYIGDELNIGFLVKAANVFTLE
jgi:hypothetical protein